MKKYILVFLMVFFAITIPAQNATLAKTSWKVEKVNTDGSAIFVKSGFINFPEEQPTVYFLQFSESKEYRTGNSCFQMIGRYTAYENGTLQMREGTADQSSDCKEPKIFSGDYQFKMTGNKLELIPIN